MKQAKVGAKKSKKEGNRIFKYLYSSDGIEKMKKRPKTSV